MSNLGDTGSCYGVCEDEEVSAVPFDISTSIQRLKRWRQAALVLKSVFRFQYTLDLKKNEEMKQTIRKIRGHSQAIRSALLFKEAGEKANVVGTHGGSSQISRGGYAIGREQLASITRDHTFSVLKQYGGVTGLLGLLKTTPDKGIPGDDTDLLNRRDAFGSLTYPRKKRHSFWRFLLKASKGLALINLMIAAAASLALEIVKKGIKEGWYEGGSIAFAVLVIIIVTAITDYRQYLQFQNLNEEKRNIRLKVIRDGKGVKISIFDIVVGDVVPLINGNQVPADGILISGNSLAIYESSMTGKSEIVHKDQEAPFLMSGCKVADGCGKMLVTGVGINTEWELVDTREKTPLQVRLNRVATFIGFVKLGVALAVVVVLLARYFTGHTKNPDGTVQFVSGKTRFCDALKEAFEIFNVAETPEVLHLAVILILSYSMQKMMAEKARVRRISACETMGSATTICSDKALNPKIVVEAYVGREKIDPPDNVSALSPTVASLLIEGIARNTTGNVFISEGGGEIEVAGSPAEKAILSWGLKLGMKIDDVRSMDVVLFNSEKKRGGGAQKLPESEVCKGAAETLLDLCIKYLDPSGSFLPMNEDEARNFERTIEDMTTKSLRCVAIAYSSSKMNPVSKDEEKRVLPDDLVLLAIVGLKDAYRQGVKDDVQLCKNAGVKVRLVTGDNLETAKELALECGIIDSDADADASEPNLIEGSAFHTLSESKREDIAGKISVMWGSSPNDKLLLVQALRKRGHVVAVTGDGPSDAPTLHEADIGLAMGIQGTEVEKESSDIIILDGNFASVVKVVHQGRSVYANIQKFFQFQLTFNVAALIINIVAALASGSVPLNVVQLLWVSLIIETLGAFALVMEPPTDDLMHRKPVDRREPNITNVMWRNIIVQAIYQVTVLLTLNFQEGRSILWLKHDNSDHANKVKNTLIFNVYVLCQIFNEFNARKRDEINVFKGITKHLLFMVIVGISFVLQVIMIEFLGKFTSTVKLGWKLWLVSVAIGFVSWPLAILGKLIPVPETPFGEYFTMPVRHLKAA